MSRLLTLVAVAVAASACGAEQRQGVGTPSTGGAETLETPSVANESTSGPPRIVMTSAAGRQEAVAGSFCVDDPARGVGTCADSGPVDPTQLTVARPGEVVRVALVDARMTGGSVVVRPLGCEEKTTVRLELHPGRLTRFALDVEDGAYELDVFAPFVAEDGRSGDVSGSLGVLVDENRTPEVVAASANHRVCPEG